MRNRLASAALLPAFALLAGCASLAPDYRRPPLPVPAEFPALPRAPGATAGPTALPGHWRAYFTDPRLQQLIALALEHNRDLRMAVSRVEQARAAYGIERAAQTPSLGIQAGAERGRIPADLNLARRPLHTSQYQVGLALASWELDFWGRVRSLGDAALETYLASDAARSAAGVALVGQVALTYLDLCDTTQRIALARRTLDSRQKTFDMVARRAAVGSSSQLQLAQIETLLIQARALLLQLEQERDLRHHALALLVGAAVPLPDERDAEPPAQPVPAPGLPSDLLAQRPDIVAAEHRLRAANAGIGAARAAFFPRIALTGSFGSASAELDGLFAAGSRAWTFGPSIGLPLLDGGRRKDQLSIAEARRDEALAAYDKTVQSAFRDVSDALSALHWLDGQSTVAGDAVRVQRRRAHLAELRHGSGASSYLEVLDAQRDLLGAEQQLVHARHAVLAARVSLYLALGGGAAEALPASVSESRSISESNLSTPRL